MWRNQSSVLFATLLAFAVVGCDNSDETAEGESYEEQVAQADAVAVITPVSSAAVSTAASQPVSSAASEVSAAVSTPAPAEPPKAEPPKPAPVAEPAKPQEKVAAKADTKVAAAPAKKVKDEAAPKKENKVVVAQRVETPRAAETPRTPVEAPRTEAARPVETRVAAANTSSEPAHQKGLSGFADDSPENIKLRSAPGDPVAGKDKSQLCQGCHGEDGNSTEAMIPKLAGQYAKYISKNLRNFQTGIRTHQIMSAMAATIDDDDLADISAYFASRPKMKGRGSVAGGEVGKEIFLNGDMNRMIVSCVNCHGVNGKGKTPTNSTFPVIGGQQEGYLRGQLLNWRKGERTNSPGGIMNIIAQKLTDAEIDSLAKYISGL